MNREYFFITLQWSAFVFFRLENVTKFNTFKKQDDSLRRLCVR